MATTEKVVSGRCPNHGIVRCTQTVPKVSFPFIVYGVRRVVAAASKPVCPQCGAKVDKV